MIEVPVLAVAEAVAGHSDRAPEAAVLVDPAQLAALAGHEDRRRLGKALGVEGLVQLGPGKAGDTLRDRHGPHPTSGVPPA